MTERVDRFTQDQMLAAALGKKTLTHRIPANCLGRMSKVDIKPAANPCQ
jgi:hypothetical protein